MMEITSVKRVHQSDWTNSGVRFLRARDLIALSKNEKIEEPLYISMEQYEKYSIQSGKVSKGDLLVTGVGTIGVPMLIDSTEPIYFKDGNVIWFKNAEKIDSNFLYYSFTNKTIQDFIKNVAGIGTVGTYTIDNGKKTPISLPTKEEQTTIGNFFKQLDETIALHQRQTEKYQKLKIGFLESVFCTNLSQNNSIKTNAWEQRKLGEITISFSGGTPIVGNKEYYNGKIPFIRSGEINSDKTELFISQSGLENSSAKLIKKGDILYALYGATSGEVGRSKIDGAINQAILAIIPNEKNDPEFIAQWLRKHKSSIIQTYLQGGQGNLSGEIVKNLMIIKPKSSEEQTAIGNFFKQLDETIALHRRQMEKYQQIKQLFLDKMFVK